MENNQNCKFNISRSFALSRREFFCLFSFVFGFCLKISFEECRLFTIRSGKEGGEVSVWWHREISARFLTLFRWTWSGWRAEWTEESSAIETASASDNPRKVLHFSSCSVHCLVFYSFLFLSINFNITFSSFHSPSHSPRRGRDGAPVFYGFPCGLEITKQCCFFLLFRK